ncbi:hypothetical protein QP835_11390 [Pseudomonas oryzihabitans]|uniref:HNH endonuclease n=1 Tax=Pseudomonas oryzihabitans TaxID=47885 RepID=UPI00255467C1|nr:hypothetical protein [Pseudomonas oryzihabitans]MDK8264880.1 hypothetical protein [Pseudomonas oryzihabitans]
MPDYCVTSEAELEREFQDYIKSCHDKEARREDVVRLLRRFHATARYRFDRKNRGEKCEERNLWGEFSNPKAKKVKEEATSELVAPVSLGKAKRPRGKAQLAVSDIKGAFRRFIERSQKNRCCYCRRWLSNSGYSKPIEHILPRVHFEQYSFHFRNLSVACVDCNGLKDEANWAEKSKLNQKEYPSPDSFTEMFHPRFHRYDDHVRFIRIQTNDHNITLYRGITPQGEKLCEDLLRTIAGKELIVSANPALKDSMETIEQFDVTEGSELELALKDLLGALSGRSLELLRR